MDDLGLFIAKRDAFKLDGDDLAGIDAVYDRAALIALPPAMRNDYARLLIKTLPKAARILLITLEYPQAQMDGPPFSVHSEEIHALFGDNFNIEHLLEQDVLAESEKFRDRGLTSLIEKVYTLRRSQKRP